MTTNELAAHFTAPNDHVRVAREIIILALERAIVEQNKRIATATYGADIQPFRNGLVLARNIVADTVDWEGKILQSVVEEYQKIGVQS